MERNMSRYLELFFCAKREKCVEIRKIYAYNPAGNPAQAYLRLLIKAFGWGSFEVFVDWKMLLRGWLRRKLIENGGNVLIKDVFSADCGCGSGFWSVFETIEELLEFLIIKT